MKKNKLIKKILLIGIFSLFLNIFFSINILTAHAIDETDMSGFKLLSPPDNLNIRNPGNLPFIHDPDVTFLDETNQKTYGVIKNEKAYIAFGKALEFSIKTLIKLVGVMSLFGILEGIIRLVVAHGEDEIYSKGIKMIMWSIVGLCLSLVAHAVVTGFTQFITGIGTVDI